MSDETFLSRWSKRKHGAKRESPEAAVGNAPDPVPTPAGHRSSDPPVPAPEGAQAALPAVESLTPESDFAPFMRADVEESLKRRALKTLFQDPRFNVMDGLDVYVDDYSKPDPLPEGWLEKMNQVARLGEYREPEPEEPPAVAAEGAAPAGQAESVPPEPVPAEETSAPPTPGRPVAES